MIIFPAIDLLDEKCVRLYQGKYSTAEQVANDPYKTVERFIKEGATHLHVVDLNAARGEGKKNFNIIKKLCEYPIKIDVGGGIRNMESVEKYLEAGVDKIVIGTAAIKDPPFLECVLEKYPESVIVGVDAKYGKVKTDGWHIDSGIDYLDYIKALQDLGVKYITYTDISKDGTLAGVNTEDIIKIQKIYNHNIISSGGVKDIEDIKKLKKLNIYGAICGKSLYANTLSLEEAIKVSQV
ncbi:MAG TPA: 1-(5-phosphoribosyl)-5-[(5-phosphoribosylamino)methylideneamino]imidazole-4-carboxamide isomerase [Clostridia bacterium]|jgi:phosphoribosylformimino-5-aminoimidazole carboxamide ribotide isomerase|nr:1-(5-phosphoribosyl)-5-[(5-phosphoribosylamino)methylideneamino]imidazole-4-carboxamide isomerase [Clostridia bacterium]